MQSEKALNPWSKEEKENKSNYVVYDINSKKQRSKLPPIYYFTGRKHLLELLK